MIAETQIGDAEIGPRTGSAFGPEDVRMLLPKSPLEVVSQRRDRGGVGCGHRGGADQFGPEPSLGLEIGAG